MSGSKVIAMAGGFVALLASAGVSTAAAETCVLGTEYQVTSVEPYKRPIQTGGYADSPNQVLRGADIHVAPRQGLTSEWLERKLEAQVAAGECQFGVARPGVDVVPEADTFVVRITTGEESPGIARLPIREPGERAAADILSQARTFVK